MRPSRRLPIFGPTLISFLVACSQVAPAIATRTPAPVELAPSATSTVVVVPTDTPEPSPTIAPRVLHLCQSAEPQTLYIYGGSMLAMSNVLEAVYDGPIDNNGFSYQPVILEKLPSLADGDARIEAVEVGPGDTIVDETGNPVALAEGVRYLPAGCTSPDCALEYAGGTVQMDQLSATFTLLEGLQWSDGRALTAADSVFSYELAGHLETPTSKTLIDRTASYTQLDALSVKWTGLPGYLDQTYFVNFWSPLPEHQLSAYSPSELLEADVSARKPMGWGPYVIAEWEYGSHIRMYRNDRYFRNGEGLPRFDTVIVRITGENSTLNIAKLLTGECDLLSWESHLDDSLAELIELDQAGMLQFHAATGTIWEHADFGIRPFSYEDGYQAGTDRMDFFGDVRTRQAIALCMDRQAVVDTVFLGGSQVLHTYIPISHPLFNAEAPRYPFDVETGRALLEQAGWIDPDGDPATPRVAQGVANVPDGTPLSFNFWTTTATRRIQAVEILAASLARCGVELKLEFWEPGEFFADGPVGPIFGRRFDMVQFAWLTGVQPPCDLWLSANISGPADAGFEAGWGASNAAGYSSAEFDQACQEALRLLPGQPGYEQAHLDAQEIFARDLPVIPLYLRIKISAARADFCGYVLDPTSGSDFWSIEEFDYGDGCAD